MKDPKSKLRSLLMPQGPHHPTWTPSADVYRTENSWVVKLDLAGVAPEDVNIEMRSSTLVISGVRRDRLVGESYVPYTMEIFYSRFERTFELPVKEEQVSIKKEHRDGMLLVVATEVLNGD